MYSGAITANIDVAQVVLYMFWAFFAGLVYYLHRENKREGYPLESGSDIGRHRYEGFPATPEPKTFTLAGGETWQAPGPNSGRQVLTGGEMASRVPGSPIGPIGNPMLAGVGPGAYAQRADVPDMTFEGALRIVPLRLADGYDVDHHHPDPRAPPPPRPPPPPPRPPLPPPPPPPRGFAGGGPQHRGGGRGGGPPPRASRM